MTQKCAVKAGLMRPDWDKVKVEAMEWVLELKLFHHPKTFGEELKRTEGKSIAEVSRKDAYWGTIETTKGVLVGENQLGKALMRVRDRQDQVTKGVFTYPNGFLLPP